MIGIPGNILTLIVLNSKAYEYSVSNISLNVLAGPDLFALVTLLFRSLENWGYPLRIQSDGSCKFITYILQLATKFASMVLTVIMIERAVSVSFPLHAKTLITKRRLLAAYLFMLGFFLLFYIPVFLYHEVTFVAGMPECDLYTDYPVFLDYYYPYSTALFEVFLPFSVIMISSGVIIFKIRQAHHARQAQLGQNEDDNLTSTTLMLASVGVVFLICMLPRLVDEIGFPLNMYGDTDWGIAVNWLMVYTSFSLARLNNALNFFVYCLTGKRFRSAFITVMCPCRKGKVKEHLPGAKLSSKVKCAA